MHPTSTRQAQELLLTHFQNVLRNLNEAKTDEEIRAFLHEFSIKQYNPDELVLDGKPLKENLEYIKIRVLLEDFFNWVETNNSIYILKMTSEDPFYNANINGKMLLSAELISLIQSLNKRAQIYIMLNLFRTNYELNLRSFMLILRENLKKRGISLSENEKTIGYFKNEFRGYPKIEELTSYFVKDLRNSIAHEEWILNEKENICFKENESLEEITLEEIAKRIYSLFFFRAAFQACLFKRFNATVDSIKIDQDKISNLKTLLKREIDNLTRILES